MEEEDIIEEIALSSLDIFQPGLRELRWAFKRIIDEKPVLAGVSVFSAIINPIIAVTGILLIVAWAIGTDDRRRIDLSDIDNAPSEWSAALSSLPIMLIPFVGSLLAPAYASIKQQKAHIKDGAVDYHAAARVGAKTLFIPVALASFLIVLPLTVPVLLSNIQFGVMLSLLATLIIILNLVFIMLMGSVLGVVGVRLKSG